MKTRMDIEAEVELLEELVGDIGDMEDERLAELMELLFEKRSPLFNRYKQLCRLAAISRLVQIRSGRPHPAEPANVYVGSGELRIQVPPQSRCKVP